MPLSRGCPRSGPRYAVTTNGRDCQVALRTLKVERPFLVFPAWFDDATLQKGVTYFAEQRVSPFRAYALDPFRKWRDVPPRDLYPQGMAFEQEVEISIARCVRNAQRKPTGC